MADTGKYEATFALVDGNSDGLVSVDELHRLMQVLGREVSPEKAAEILRKLDTDGDGHVSLAEFADFMEQGED
jgi:Ca2+-binding EF-hand superfamily protein